MILIPGSGDCKYHNFTFSFLSLGNEPISGCHFSILLYISPLKNIKAECQLKVGLASNLLLVIWKQIANRGMKLIVPLPTTEQGP